MKTVVAGFALLVFIAVGCNKHHENNQEDKDQKAVCDIQKVRQENEAKVSIVNGIWGTLAFQEGNCMPMLPPGNNTCRTCPVKRTLRIYEYTTIQRSTPKSIQAFYESFRTQLIREVEADDNGFFQTELPAGKYTIVAVENGKLYAFGFDGQAGISVVTVNGGKQKSDLTFTYNAVY